jgi:hypothetical protein
VARALAARAGAGARESLGPHCCTYGRRATSWRSCRRANSIRQSGTETVQEHLRTDTALQSKTGLSARRDPKPGARRPSRSHTHT